MELGARFRDLFRKPIQAELEDPSSRDAAILAMCRQAAQIRGNNPSEPDSWRKPLLEVAEILEQIGEDSTGLYRTAATVIPEDEFWRKSLLSRVMPRAHLDVTDLVHLRREAIANPRKLPLWQRLLEEGEYYENPELVAEINNSFVLSVSPFFPPQGESTWFDVETEVKARSMFFNRLDEAVDHVIQEQRADDQALRILETAYAHFPTKSAIIVQLAHIHRMRGAKEPNSLGIILQALLYEPDDTELKKTAARLLMDRPGHEREGLDLMLQAFEEAPHDPEVSRDLTYFLAKAGHLEEEHVEIVFQWFRQNPQDFTAVALLAEYYKKEDPSAERAVEVFEAAARLRPEEPRYLRLHAQSCAGRQMWKKAISAYEKLIRIEGKTESNILGLAQAYANDGREDKNAYPWYLKAVKLESRSPKVHNFACRYLYDSAPDEPESIEIFHKSLRIFPDETWAKLGVAREQLRFQDYDRAREKIMPYVLGAEPVPEAIELAGKLLAARPNRSHMRHFISLPPATAMLVFAVASREAPESFLIMINLARYRLRNGKRDQETVDLLAEICKRDQDELEFHLARADILYELGDRRHAVRFYRELLKRGKDSSSGTSAHPLLPDNPRYSEILERCIDYFTSTNSLDYEDTNFLMHLTLDPAVPQGCTVPVASWIVRTGTDHEWAPAILERAMSLEPDETAFEETLALLRVRRGNARPALEIAMKRLEALRFDKETLEFLECIVEYVPSEQVSESVRKRVLQLAERRRFLPDPLVILLAKLLIASGEDRPEFVPLLERALKSKGADGIIANSLEHCRRAGK